MVTYDFDANIELGRGMERFKQYFYHLDVNTSGLERFTMDRSRC